MHDTKWDSHTEGQKKGLIIGWSVLHNKIIHPISNWDLQVIKCVILSMSEHAKKTPTLASDSLMSLWAALSLSFSIVNCVNRRTKTQRADTHTHTYTHGHATGWVVHAGRQTVGKCIYGGVKQAGSLFRMTNSVQLSLTGLHLNIRAQLETMHPET